MERIVSSLFVWLLFAACFQLPPGNVFSALVSGVPALLFWMSTSPRYGKGFRFLFAIVAVFEAQLDSWALAPGASAADTFFVAVAMIALLWWWSKGIQRRADTARPPDPQIIVDDGWRLADDGVGWVRDPISGHPATDQATTIHR